jgi:hypothetical protein
MGRLQAAQATDDEVNDMALARDFKETIRARVQRDPKVRDALLNKDWLAGLLEAAPGARP